MGPLQENFRNSTFRFIKHFPFVIFTRTTSSTYFF